MSQSRPSACGSSCSLGDPGAGRAPPLDLGWDDVLTVLLVDPGLRAGVERGSHPVERPQMGGDRPGPLVWHIIDWNEELFVGFSTLGRQASAGWRNLLQFCGLLCGVMVLAGSSHLAYTFLVLGGALTSLQTPQHSVLLLGCARSASGARSCPATPPSAAWTCGTSSTTSWWCLARCWWRAGLPEPALKASGSGRGSCTGTDSHWW